MGSIRTLPEKVGRLTILVALDDMSRYTLCRCDCGTEKLIFRANLLKEVTLSCGCLRREVSKARHTTHDQAGGMSSKVRRRTPEYETWVAMRKRCLNPKDMGYKNYGGRGITICQRWLHSFEDFFSDMGKRPAGYSIDRVNNDGNYEPSNCRWATRSEQMKNRRWSAYSGFKNVKQRTSDDLVITEEASGSYVKLV